MSKFLRLLALAANVPCAAAVAEKNFVIVNIAETYCKNEYTNLLVNSNSNCAVLAEVAFRSASCTTVSGTTNVSTAVKR